MQTNVGHSVTDEIININSKNIGNIVKKRAVLVFKKYQKLLMIRYKKLCGPLLKEHQKILL